jgi:hypothetical protein
MACSETVRSDGGDRGASLVIALLFMTVGSLLALSLANSAGNNLLDTSGLRVQRDLEYAADGALSGAVQEVRYHGACESFPPAGNLQISGLYVFVQCNGTSMFVNTTSGTGNLNPLSGLKVFLPEDSGLTVAGACIPGGTQTVTYVSPTVLTMPQNATCTATSATPDEPVVGGFQQRTDLLWACVSSTAIASCSDSTAVATAIVTFYDTDPITGKVVIGHDYSAQSWVVRTAKG